MTNTIDQFRKSIFFILFLFSSGFICQNVFSQNMSYLSSNERIVSPNLYSTIHKPQYYSFQDDKTQLLSYEHYQNEYKKATRQRRTGVILVAVGVPAFFVGLGGASVILISNSNGDSKSAEVAFATFGILIAAGFIAVNVGIPAWIAGGIKRKKNREVMEAGWPERSQNDLSLSAVVTPDGLGMRLSF
jgi:hypothetical protein